MPRKRQEVQPGRRIVSEGTLRRHAQSFNSTIFCSRVVKTVCLPVGYHSQCLSSLAPLARKARLRSQAAAILWLERTPTE